MLLHEGAAAYFQKSTLDLDKNSNRLTVTIETVLRQVQHQKDLALLLRASTAKAGL